MYARVTVTYVGERFVLIDDRRLVFRLRVQFGRGMPHHAQSRSVDEIFVPVSRRFYVRPVEVRYYLRGKRYPRVDATETVGTTPRVARRIVRFQTGHRVHGISENVIQYITYGYQ